jgi:hypothetical protein
MHMIPVRQGIVACCPGLYEDETREYIETPVLSFERPKTAEKLITRIEAF